MEVKIDSLATTPNSLRFGCVVKGPENSWIQFCQVVIEDKQFTQQELHDLWAWVARVLNAYLDHESDEPLGVDAPLF